MKKIKKIISLMFTIVILLSFTLNVASNQQDKTQENNDIIKLNFSFPSPSIETLNINDEIFHRIKIDGLSNSHNYNKPEIPVKSVRILIPYNMEFHLPLEGAGQICRSWSVPSHLQKPQPQTSESEDSGFLGRSLLP